MVNWFMKEEENTGVIAYLKSFLLKTGRKLGFFMLCKRKMDDN